MALLEIRITTLSTCKPFTNIHTHLQTCY